MNQSYIILRTICYCEFIIVSHSLISNVLHLFPQFHTIFLSFIYYLRKTYRVIYYKCSYYVIGSRTL